MQRSALRIVQWSADQASVKQVPHPALPSCEGHDQLRRDFTGSASIFSVVFTNDLTQQQVNDFVNGLRLFKIGWSRRHNKLVMSYPAYKTTAIATATSCALKSVSKTDEKTIFNGAFTATTCRDTRL